MRTKTLILSAVAGLIACVAAKADTNVYSLNAVGYINVTILPGFNMIGNQLNNVTNGVVDNTLGTLINNKIDIGGSTGPYDFCAVYKWLGSSYASESGDFTSGGGWSGGGVMTLNPGEAVWFQNPSGTNIVLTFFGEVVQGTQTNTLPLNYSQRTSIVPQAGGLDSVLGLHNTETSPGSGQGIIDNDAVYVWTPNGSGGGSYASANADYSSSDNAGTTTPSTPGTAWNPSEPVLTVGQGFFYFANAQRSWVRTFSANN